MGASGGCVLGGTLVAIVVVLVVSPVFGGRQSGFVEEMYVPCYV